MVCSHNAEIIRHLFVIDLDPGILATKLLFPEFNDFIMIY